MLPRRMALTLLILSALVVVQRAEAGQKTAFRWEDHPEVGHADLYYGDAPALRYMYAYDDSTPPRRDETYKVYHHVFGPGTGGFITKGPGGLYTHHRGMFVGWNKTHFDGKTLDFWHCRNGAHLKHVKFLKKAGDEQSGTMTAEIHWNGPDDKTVIREIRTVTVRPLPQPEGYGWQIDWHSTLHSEAGEIRLDGDRQHAGFQFRAAQEVAETNGARYIRPAAFPDQPAAIQVGDKGDPPPHIDLGWLAMTYELDGTRYTVEYFEDPALPDPSLYSERPYGRFGAFFRATITPDEPLTLHYRLNVTEGPAPSRAQIQKRYDAFVADRKSGS